MSRRGLLVLVGLVTLCVLAAGAAVPLHPDARPPNSPTAVARVLRYVSPHGHDNSPGTETRPWRTLSRALPALQPGETLYVRGGTYREELTKLPIHQGTPERRIVVKAYEGERPVVRGLFWLSQPSYWTINGLNVTWDPSIRPAPSHMVKLTGGVGWIWRNSEIWGSRASSNLFIAGYGQQEPADWALEKNCIHDVRPPKRLNRSSNLWIGGLPDAAGPGRVRRNVLFDAPGLQNVTVGSTAGSRADVQFRYNTVYGGDVAVTLVGDAIGVRMFRNILGGVSSGILIRWNGHPGSVDAISQNLGVDADRFMRPEPQDLMGGPGNVLTDDVKFPNVSQCDGFRTDDAIAIPYGRYGVG